MIEILRSAIDPLIQVIITTHFSCSLHFFTSPLHPAIDPLLSQVIINPFTNLPFRSCMFICMLAHHISYSAWQYQFDLRYEVLSSLLSSSALFHYLLCYYVAYFVSFEIQETHVKMRGGGGPVVNMSIFFLPSTHMGNTSFITFLFFFLTTFFHLLFLVSLPLTIHFLIFFHLLRCSFTPHLVNLPFRLRIPGPTYFLCSK